ncbi:MAG TPA: HEAT repeat domain-containing protein, partial [Polyangiaceae bacterium]|nr:HEAT repeat domain-containing protein [Polyangiaceae bacterium]
MPKKSPGPEKRLAPKKSAAAKKRAPPKKAAAKPAAGKAKSQKSVAKKATTPAASQPSTPAPASPVAYVSSDEQKLQKLVADFGANLPEPDPAATRSFFRGYVDLGEDKNAVEGLLLGAMQSSHVAWRLFAVEHAELFKYHDPKALAAVRQLLLTDPSSDVRRACADSLERLNGFETPEPAILEALKTERDVKVRYALAKCGLRLTPKDDRSSGAQLVNVLIDALTELELERDEVEHGLLRALDWEWNPRLMDVVLKEPSAYFRAARFELVATVRGAAKDPSVREYLLQLFRTESDADARAVVLERLLFPQLEATPNMTPFYAEPDPERHFEKSFIQELLLEALEHHSKPPERKAIAARLKKHAAAASPKVAQVLSSESSLLARVALFETKLTADGVEVAGKLAGLASLGRLPATTEQAEALSVAYRQRGEAGIAALVG